MLAEPILVGRDLELQKLEQCLNNVIQGHGSTIFISGEAGSGKTRLTTEFLNYVKEKNVKILSGRCLSNVSEPYFPFADAFNSSTNDNNDDSFVSEQLELSSLIDGSTQIERVKELTPQALKDQTLASVTKKFLLMATNKPVILFLDDVHWADSASLTLLHYITRSIGAERILVIATYRSEEVNAQQDDHPHPLIDVLRLLGREGILQNLQLQKIGKSDISKIIESMLGGKADDTLVEKLANDSLGNPLFVVESVRMLCEQNRLQKNGSWKLIGEDLGIPTKVKDVIMRRVESLKPDHRRILYAASVVGEKFDPEIVAQVLQLDSIDVLETLDAIAESTTLVHCIENCFAFDHAKSREMLYEKMSPLLKRKFHLRIAEQMQKVNKGSIQFSDLAYHFIEAGEKEKSIEYSVAAGKHALETFSNLEALRYFSYVLQTIDDNVESCGTKMVALEGLGDALYGNSKFSDAIDAYESLCKIATGVTKLRGYRKAMEAAFFQNDIPHLTELISKAEGYAAVDRLENARVLVNRGRVALMYKDMPMASIKDQEEALRIFREEYSLWDVAWALLGVGSALPLINQLPQGLASELEAISIFDELGDLRWQARARMRACVLFSVADMNQKAMEIFNEAKNIFEKIGDFSMLAEAYATYAVVLEDAGDLNGALNHSLIALDYCKKTDSTWALSMTLASLARIYSKLGNITQAQEYFERLQKFPPQSLLNAMVRKTSTEILYYAGRNQFELANKSLNTYLEQHKKTLDSLLNARFKADIAWSLTKQGRLSEAAVQRSAAVAAMQLARAPFENLTIKSNLLVPTEVIGNTPVNLRITVINNSNLSANLLTIENLNSYFKLIDPSSQYNFSEKSLNLEGQKILPFNVKIYQLKIQFQKAGCITLSPRIVLSDCSGHKHIIVPNEVTVKVEGAPKNEDRTDSSRSVATASIEKVEGQVEPVAAKQQLIFEANHSKKAFDYLVESFSKDYMRKKLTLEKAGWRSLVEIVKNGNVPVRSVYGDGPKRLGSAISELERRGLIEVRVFVGERGRGGNIFKTRVAYDREPIKRLIDEAIYGKVKKE